MGNMCGNICTGPAKEQELNIERAGNDMRIGQNSHFESDEIEIEFLKIIKNIKYPNSTVKVFS